MNVAILIKRKFSSCEVNVKHPVGALFDMCCIDVQIDGFKYRFISIYRPPGTLACNVVDAVFITSCLSALLDSSCIYFIAGDFSAKH